MGYNLSIDGYDYKFHPTSYTVQEDATPLPANDSFGSVGTIDITLPMPDEYAGGRTNPLVRFGPEWLIDKTFVFTDTERGSIPGTFLSANVSLADGTIRVSGLPRTGILNVYNVNAQPFVGTLGNAIAYYLSLANVTTGYSVDSTLAARYVEFPGWTGELWYHMKQMSQVHNIDISLVNGTIYFRPIRRRTIERGVDISKNRDLNLPTLAQAVEVYNYKNRAITNELVYPPKGWTPEVEVYNVNAGETAEYTLELSSSVSSIQTPVFQTNVTPAYAASSVYTVVANDGLALNQQQWINNGGHLELTINPDTVTLNLKITGPTGIPTIYGTVATNFSIALASDSTGNRYSTLRVVGTGVAFDKGDPLRVRTGVPASKAPTEVGVTVDNPFVSNLDDCYRIGTRAAREFAYPAPDISADIIRAIPLGDSEWLGSTFGNVAGARVWDSASKRFYRVRESRFSEGSISYSADDDLIYGDVQEHFDGYTYGDIQDLYAGFNYLQVERRGLVDFGD